MKKVLVLFAAFVLLTLNQAFAYRATDFSNDTKIVAAINLLEQAGETDVLRNLQRYAVKVSFDDLSAVTMNSSKAFAVSTYNNYGSRVIMINSIYKNAPVEQIACLIAHESCHTKRVADLEEETVATQKEAATWIRLKNTSKVYPDSRLTRRLDKLSGLYLASSEGNNLVQQKIASSGFYRNQLGLN
ncbi:hypothetical protein IJ750_00035 [bacterium]|nr:hypothetical protein [bacterium]